MKRTQSDENIIHVTSRASNTNAVEPFKLFKCMQTYYVFVCTMLAVISVDSLNLVTEMRKSVMFFFFFFVKFSSKNKNYFTEKNELN